MACVGAAYQHAACVHAHRLRLAKLLRVHSSHDPEKLTSLEAYVERMKPDQKQIYFVSGPPPFVPVLLYALCSHDLLQEGSKHSCGYCMLHPAIGTPWPWKALLA